MSPMKIALSEVNDFSRDFTVTAKLESILPSKLSRSGVTKIQKLLFKDENVEMEATLFDDDISLFAGIFREGKTYEITNPTVSRVKEEFRKDNNEYQMVIHSRTRVVELLAAEIIDTEMDCVPITSFEAHINHKERLDIIGVVIAVLNFRTVHVKTKDIDYDIRDIIIVDKNLCNVKITLWRDLAENEAEELARNITTMPVVHITRVRASDFKEGGWSTSPNSTIKQNTSGPTSVELQQWAQDNVSVIDALRRNIDNDIGQSSQQVQVTFNEDLNITSVVDFIDLQEQKDVWLKGKIIKINNFNNYVYNACHLCRKKTPVQLNESFSCGPANKPHTGISVPRCILHVTFADDTGSINITLFHLLAETLLKYDATQISTLNVEERRSLIDDVLTNAETQKYAIKMRPYKIEAYNTQLRWNANQIEEVSY